MSLDFENIVENASKSAAVITYKQDSSGRGGMGGLDGVFSSPASPGSPG